jgi:flagellin-specific chaperone FliS
MKKLNQITPLNMQDIMEGLGMLIMNAKTQNDVSKVQRVQQLADNLNEYATEFSRKQENKQ